MYFSLKEAWHLYLLFITDRGKSQVLTPKVGPDPALLMLKEAILGKGPIMFVSTA